MSKIRFEHINGQPCRMVEPEPQTEPCEICGGIGMISCEACNATGRVPIEPDPQPAYAVGDWVQCGIMQAEIIEIREILNGRQIYHIKEADGTEYDADSSAFVRKLSSSEVRVKITLEGTVRKSQLVGCFVLDTPLPGNDVHTIRFADIDPATAALVRDLLEKQGEEK